MNSSMYNATGGLTSCFCTGACTELGYCPATRDTVQRIETPEEKAKRLGVELYKDTRKEFSPHDPNPIQGVCGRCGMEVRVYNNGSFCNEIECPAGIGLMLMSGGVGPRVI